MKRRTTTGKRRTPTGNQRVSTTRQRKQQHLLDVKVRSYKFKQQRNRKVLNIFFKLVVIASLGAGAFYGGRACMNRFFWRNPDYTLTAVEIADDGTLSRKDILDAAHIHEGENIFSINLSKAHDSLSDLPEVDHVEIDRVLPGKISIAITERKPIARLTAKATDDLNTPGAFLIDRKGTLIKSKNQPLREYLRMPVIFGFATDKLEEGQVLDAPEVTAALTLIDLNSDNTRFQVRSVDVSKGYCMVVTNQNHLLITFGLDHIDRQLERLGWTLDYVGRTNKILLTANLMVEHNTPVTFAPTGDDAVSDTPPPAVPAVQAPRAMPTPTPAPARRPTPAKTPNLKPLKTPEPVKRGQPFYPTN